MTKWSARAALLVMAASLWFVPLDDLGFGIRHGNMLELLGLVVGVFAGCATLTVLIIWLVVVATSE